MKSRRVTKLLACALASSLCAVPVAAANPSVTDVTGTGKVQGGTINTDFGIYAPSITVTVPTKAEVRINPLYESNTGSSGSNISSNLYQIASNDLYLSNKSVDSSKKIGIPVLFTANVTVKSKAEGVKLYYEEGSSTYYTASSNSKAKEVFMSLVKANDDQTNQPNGISENAKYTIDPSNPVTMVGSQVNVHLEEPVVNAAGNGVSGNRCGFGAYAVVGRANENADWKPTDLNVEFTYEMAPSNSQGASAPTLNPLTNVSANGISFNMLDSALDGATITKIAVHSPACALDDWVPGEDALKIKRNTAGNGWDVKVDSSNAVLQWLASSYDSSANGGLELYVSFSDGRVSKTTLTF